MVHQYLHEFDLLNFCSAFRRAKNEIDTEMLWKAKCNVHNSTITKRGGSPITMGDGLSWRRLYLLLCKYGEKKNATDCAILLNNIPLLTALIKSDNFGYEWKFKSELQVQDNASFLLSVFNDKNRKTVKNTLLSLIHAGMYRKSTLVITIQFCLIEGFFVHNEIKSL